MFHFCDLGQRMMVWWSIKHNLLFISPSNLLVINLLLILFIPCSIPNVWRQVASVNVPRRHVGKSLTVGFCRCNSLTVFATDVWVLKWYSSSCDMSQSDPREQVRALNSCFWNECSMILHHVAEPFQHEQTSNQLEKGLCSKHWYLWSQKSGRFSKIMLSARRMTNSSVPRISHQWV